MIRYIEDHLNFFSDDFNESDKKIIKMGSFSKKGSSFVQNE